MKQHLNPGEKEKLNRKQIIQWTEEAVLELNEGDKGMVRKMFTKLGHDPTVVDVF